MKGNKYIPSTKEIIALKCEKKKQRKIKGFHHNIEFIFRKEIIINFFRLKKLQYNIKYFDGKYFTKKNNNFLLNEKNKFSKVKITK